MGLTSLRLDLLLELGLSLQGMYSLEGYENLLSPADSASWMMFYLLFLLYYFLLLRAEVPALELVRGLWWRGVDSTPAVCFLFML
jgi:hypothetical protein